MLTSDFDYHLPQRLIAQSPAQPRDSSRLLVLNRDSGAIQHSRFRHLPDHLRQGDLLVMNDSRVIPARLLGRRAATGGKVELMLLHRLPAQLLESPRPPCPGPATRRNRHHPKRRRRRWRGKSLGTLGRRHLRRRT